MVKTNEKNVGKEGGGQKVNLDSCLLTIKKPTNLSTSESPLRFDMF